MATAQNIVVRLMSLRDFVIRCMEAVGSTLPHARSLADLIVAADNRGHYSHGLNRLEMYVDDLESGRMISNSEPSVVNETTATALVDGNNVSGPVVGQFCIDLAIKKAKETGIGWISARNSNHFGIAGWYSMRASDHGCLGMAFTNTSPFMIPTRGKKPVLGTNPITLAAPANNGDSFVLDMATTTVALGKIEINMRKDEKIPIGWGQDSEGLDTTEPSDVMEDGGLCPLGGSETSGGYKGYGLAMMVEIFCGILSGADYGTHVRTWKDPSDKKANLGQCFVAIDISAFAPGFSDRMSDLMNMCRNSEPAKGQTEVLVAGDPERKHIELCEKLQGIPYHPNQIDYANNLAKRLNIEKMATLS